MMQTRVTQSYIVRGSDPLGRPKCVCGRAGTPYAIDSSSLDIGHWTEHNR